MKSQFQNRQCIHSRSQMGQKVRECLHHLRKGSQCNFLSCTSTTLSSRKVEEAVNPIEEEVENREPEKLVEEVEKTTEENGEKYTEEEKQNWYMVVYKDSEEVVKEAAPKARPKVMAFPGLRH
ncbi:Uncharacterized protein Rs2_49450 [Raphanus sativus]|uniref:Uncharacterized protein LOC130504692 n=1 Tax=Raphanus sativus TaxID=3726 RepID=A0A9W3CV09_RAPSA|nr:uncharacterized protein LOC130504692 [Raphanus sativus]KAJ4869004.1 Uncharacterized protein Rs2_49450 [Raphanus sativus]